MFVSIQFSNGWLHRKDFYTNTILFECSKSKDGCEQEVVICGRIVNVFTMVNATSKRPQYFAAIAAAIGAMAFGTSLSWSSPTGPVLINEIEVTDEQISWVGSTLSFGATSMCIVTGYITNFMGRRTTLLFLVIPFTFGWIFIIFAKSITMVIVGRALLGAASGGICGVAPIYISEIAETSNRGMMCSFFQLLSTVGTLFVYFVGGYVRTDALSVICATIPLIFGTLLLFCPESPTYLVQKNKHDEAAKALTWLRGKKYDPTTELSDIQAALEYRSQQGVPQEQSKLSKALLWLRKQCQQNDFQSNWESMLCDSAVKALSVSYGLFICQQMCGVNILIFYTAEIFEIANIKFSPDVSIALIGVVAAFCSTLVADRFGRRILLLISQFVVAMCTFSLGYYFYTRAANPNGVDLLKWLPISSLCLFTVAFAIGLGPVPWVMLSELFSPDIKGMAGSISTSSSLALAFVARKTHDNLSDTFGIGGTFWLYTIFSLLGIVFVYFVVPETKGKSLNSIQQMLNELEHNEPIESMGSGYKDPLLVEDRSNNLEMKRLEKLNKNLKTL